MIIVEGIFVLLDDKLRKEFDIKLFVDTEDDTRLARRRTLPLFLERELSFLKRVLSFFISLPFPLFSVIFIDQKFYCISTE